MYPTVIMWKEVTKESVSTFPFESLDIKPPYEPRFD